MSKEIILQVECRPLVIINYKTGQKTEVVFIRFIPVENQCKEVKQE